MKNDLMWILGIWLAAGGSLAAADASRREWPQWLHAGGELRGRAEGFTGNRFIPGNNDGYYLHRIRLNVQADALPWLRLAGGVQDSQVLGYNTHPAPTSIANTLDLRQAFVELGFTKGSWMARLGRQDLVFGEERLVGAANWGNVGRAFDGARLTLRRSGMKFDWFAASVVAPVRDAWDRPHTNNKFLGFYGTLEKAVPKAILEPYVFVKTNSMARDERGVTGNLRVYTAGIRSVGKLPAQFDYKVEMAAQTGHIARDALRAWAGHWLLGYSMTTEATSPRVIAEFNHASGDRHPGNGRRGTFDNLYPTNHNYYGIADRMGWRNMHNFRTGLELKPSVKTRFTIDYHNFWLATRQDGMYLASGEMAVLNRAATSSHIGQELDFRLVRKISDHIQIILGFPHFFPGKYLDESTPGSAVTGPYAMWSYAF